MRLVRPVLRPQSSTIALIAVLAGSIGLTAPAGASAPAPQSPMTSRSSHTSSHPLRAPSPAERFQVTAGERATGRAVTNVSAPLDLSAEVQVVGLTWSRDAVDQQVQYRVQPSAGAWSAWTELDSDEADGPDGPEARSARVLEGSAPLVLTDARRVQIRIVAASSQPAASNATAMVIDPGESPSDAALVAGSTASDGLHSADQPEASSVAARPTILSRAQWGADESLREQTPPKYGSVNAAFVHHTAGTNSYTAEQVPSILRGIYAFHVTGRGWRDIGYNFLVDKFGRTWEGVTAVSTVPSSARRPRA